MSGRFSLVLLWVFFFLNVLFPGTGQCSIFAHINETNHLVLKKEGGDVLYLQRMTFAGIVLFSCLKITKQNLGFSSTWT